MSSKQRKVEDIIDIEYHDGKPIRKKVNDLDELRKELEPEKDANPFDATKAALYGDLPQASIKRDRSITARELNVLAESFMKRRFETSFSMITGNDARWKKYFNKDWEFLWNAVDGVLSTIKKPEYGYSLTLTSPKLKAQSVVDEEVEKFVKNAIEQHIKRVKA